jgi:hypothetical protein
MVYSAPLLVQWQAGAPVELFILAQKALYNKKDSNQCPLYPGQSFSFLIL